MGVHVPPISVGGLGAETHVAEAAQAGNGSGALVAGGGVRAGLCRLVGVGAAAEDYQNRRERNEPAMLFVRICIIAGGYI
jgi:hypothetical protein